jgi:hypothetical protein
MGWPVGAASMAQLVTTVLVTELQQPGQGCEWHGLARGCCLHSGIRHEMQLGQGQGQSGSSIAVDVALPLILRD